MSKTSLRILAARCHTSSCYPTIMGSADGEEVVIVGSVASALLASASVKDRVGVTAKIHRGTIVAPK
ncbi:MAG TPA: hypothetical protein VEK14_01350 [Rhodomicrobium sp.]|nr:hypothetical protein [Rhodomicrobium sp.]